MKKTISDSGLIAEVNTNGGYIDSFKLGDKLIFFPKVMVKIGDELKVRGGMHVCAPNFGLSTINENLPTHGFCRDRNWKIEEASESSIELSLAGEGDYEDVLFVLNYQVQDRSLIASIKITNNSQSEKMLAPAFHPYFYTDHEDFVVTDCQTNREDLYESMFKKESSQDLIANSNHIVVNGISNVNEFVFWTDFKGDYLCVEPTYNSTAFSDTSKKTYLLAKGSEFELKIEIKLLD